MAKDKDKPLRRTLHYKVARFSVDGKDSLQTRVKQAYGKVPKAVDRRQSITIDGNAGHRLINRMQQVGLVTCGALVAYREGVAQGTVTVDDEAEEFTIESIAPPSDESARRREFIQGLLYFGIYQNDVIYVGSLHVLSSHFEQHLQWLLKDKTGTLAKVDSVALADPIRNDYATKRFSKVRELKITSGITIAEDDDSREISERVYRPTGTTWEAIRNIVTQAIQADEPEVDFKGGLRSEDIEVTIQVRLKSARGRPNLNTPILDPLANAFRHIDDPPIQITFMDGTEIKGGDLKVSDSVSVKSVNGLPNEDDLYSKINAWLTDLLANENFSRS